MRHTLTGICYDENQHVIFVDVVIDCENIDWSIAVMQKEIDKYTAYPNYNLVLSSSMGYNINQNFIYR